MFKKKILRQQLKFSGLLFIFHVLCAVPAYPQTKKIDEIAFGSTASEQKHSFASLYSKTEKNEKGVYGRKMLPRDTADFRGGTMSFKMKVNPGKQNYFTVKCWGSEKDNVIVMLFINGLQVGYRHLGDIDLLSRGNDSPPALGRYYFMTVPLPRQQTDGRTEVQLEMRSYGQTWDYGGTFAQFQKNMTTPTRNFYKGYTHIEPYFEPAKKELTKLDIKDLPIRKGPGEEVMALLKTKVNEELQKILQKKEISQLESWFLADAYSVNWTAAYQNPAVIEKVVASLDSFYFELQKNPELISTEKSVYNPDWLNAGPYARCVRMLWTQISPVLDQQIKSENSAVSRKKAWSDVFQADLNYATTHRRQYTNQSMIIDLFLYDANKALLLIDPKSALPEYQTLKYLYESVGITPWMGKETLSGPEKPLGDNYWQLTEKGLTKELGFVGYYGEVLDWVVDIYKSTAVTGQPQSGDAKIKLQLLKMAAARYNFRYPDADDDGFKAMRAEAVVGWRDGNHYPGNIIYGDRGIAWDAAPMMTAAATLDPQAVGIAQQMMNDNQFFKMVEDKMKLGGLRVIKSLLHIPEEYELIKAQPESSERLPMSREMKDFVFSDEEDGVVAVKNGDDILYASLYWRARNAVNNLAKVHYITPEKQVISNIYIESKFKPSGLEYTRQNWVNLGFAGFREFYPAEIKSAHAGEILPIAKIPEGVSFKIGDENVFAGRADFYQMEYGDYFIVMNTTKNESFEAVIPKDFSKGKNLVTGQLLAGAGQLKIGPGSTAVIFKSTGKK
ncbi:hypothetical protein [uncultured Flavobacterium sp.]|uniref:hypothetical protein n=1 Tax=uncultured Flavobacterium sp. TaxID=165435 RepID=UPI002594AF16|nr:hypothetical protein [uncultured Flavobacterium sp.]